MQRYVGDGLICIGTEIYGLVVMNSFLYQTQNNQKSYAINKKSNKLSDAQSITIH